MQHTAQLQTYSFAGEPATPPFSFNITGAAAWKRAKALGRVNSLIRYRDTEDDDAAPAIGPAYTLTFPQDYNLKVNWDLLSGTATYWEEGTFPFRGSISALGYTTNVPDTNASFRSNVTNGLSIGENEGFAVRARLARPPRTQTRPLWALAWDDWQFHIANGKPLIMRRSSTWTQGEENSLNALLAVEAPTSAQQTEIDTLRTAIYALYQELNLGSAEIWYSAPFTLIFIPERRGILTVQVEGGESVTIRDEAIIETRAAGVLWASGPLTVSINGGFFYWQVGYPSFALTGDVELLRYKTGYWSDALEPMVFNSLQDTPSGTSITLEDLALDSIWSVIKATFTTDNARISPRLYTSSAEIPAGERTWNLDTATWDSLEKEIDLGRPILTEVEITYEGDMRRAQVQMTIADPYGRTFVGMGDNYATIEHRMASFAIDDIPLLGHGLIKETTYNDMTDSQPNQARLYVANSDTTPTATLCDVWALLEEDIMRDAPVGDGLYLGAFVRRILRNFGFSAAEYAGVSSTEGRILPRAALGETDAIKPDGNTNRADYLRDLIEKWGMGRSLWFDRFGVWHLGFRSTEVRANFIKRGATSTRYDIVKPLDSVRDPADFYNYFRVIGSRPELDRDWNVYESQSMPLGVAPTYFLGRVKPYPTVNDDGIRTLDDVNFVLRSLVIKYGKPGRYFEFGSYFIPGLFPGDRITVPGVVCEICRISNANVDNDEMKLSVREVF